MQSREGVFSYIAVIKFFLAREIRRKQLNTSPHLQFSMTHNRVCILTDIYGRSIIILYENRYD